MITVEKLRSKRGNLCEWCHIEQGTERHHCLFHKKKNHPELDDERNLMLVCSKCHQQGEVNGYEARRLFWNKQCQRYGRDNMQAFWDGALLRIKERFW